MGDINLELNFMRILFAFKGIQLATNIDIRKSQPISLGLVSLDRFTSYIPSCMKFVELEYVTKFNWLCNYVMLYSSNMTDGFNWINNFIQVFWPIKTDACPSGRINFQAQITFKGCGARSGFLWFFICSV